MNDFTQYLELLKTQLWYFGNVISKRNEFKNKAMNTKISDYCGSLENRTPLQLAYHALDPLNQIIKIIKNPGSQWGDFEVIPINLDEPSIEFIQIYQKILDEANLVLKNIDFSHFTGNMEELKNNDDLFVSRLKIFCMHAMTHYGQAIKFHGLICHHLKNELN